MSVFEKSDVNSSNIIDLSKFRAAQDDGRSAGQLIPLSGDGEFLEKVRAYVEAKLNLTRVADTSNGLVNLSKVRETQKAENIFDEIIAYVTKSGFSVIPSELHKDLNEKVALIQKNKIHQITRLLESISSTSLLDGDEQFDSVPPPNTPDVDFIHSSIVNLLKHGYLVEAGLIRSFYFGHEHQLSIFTEVYARPYYYSPTSHFEYLKTSKELYTNSEQHLSELAAFVEGCNKAYKNSQSRIKDMISSSVLYNFEKELSELKYNVNEIEFDETDENIAKNSGIRVGENFIDSDEYFANKFSIDYYAARRLIDRISEKVYQDKTNAWIESEDFIRLMKTRQVLENIKGFIPGENSLEQKNYVGSLDFGAGKVSCNFTDKKWGEDKSNQLYLHVHVSDDRNYGSTIRDDDYFIEYNGDASLSELFSTFNGLVDRYNFGVRAYKLPTYGSKYPIKNESNYKSEIMKDLKDAIASEILPKGIAYTVSFTRRDLRITLKKLPDDLILYTKEYLDQKNSRDYSRNVNHYTQHFHAINRAIEKICEAYEFDESETQVDYYNYNFKTHVKLHESLEKECLERSIAFYYSDGANNKTLSTESEINRTEDTSYINALTAFEGSNSENAVLNPRTLKGKELDGDTLNESSANRNICEQDVGFIKSMPSEKFIAESKKLWWDNFNSEHALLWAKRFGSEADINSCLGILRRHRDAGHVLNADKIERDEIVNRLKLDVGYPCSEYEIDAQKFSFDPDSNSFTDNPIDSEFKNNPKNEVAIVTAFNIVEHVTGRNKTLRGIVIQDINLESAKALDPYTFKKDGGYFIREKHLDKLNNTGGKISNAHRDGAMTCAWELTSTEWNRLNQKYAHQHETKNELNDIVFDSRNSTMDLLTKGKLILTEAQFQKIKGQITHELVIEHAVKLGKNVPTHVLNEYSEKYRQWMNPEPELHWENDKLNSMKFKLIDSNDKIIGTINYMNEHWNDSFGGVHSDLYSAKMAIESLTMPIKDVESNRLEKLSCGDLTSAQNESLNNITNHADITSIYVLTDGIKGSAAVSYRLSNIEQWALIKEDGSYALVESEQTKDKLLNIVNRFGVQIDSFSKPKPNLAQSVGV